MTNDWQPKEEHLAVVSRTIEFISDELSELQETIQFQNSYIVEIAHKVISKYQKTQTIIRREEE